MSIPTPQRYCHTALSMHPDEFGEYVKWAEVDALLVQRAQVEDPLKAKIQNIEAASLPDMYSEHPDLIWRNDVLAVLADATRVSRAPQQEPL